MRPCIDFPEQMNAVLDGEATPAQEAELTAHLALCPACAALYEDLRALREGADGLLVQAPDGFAGAVMERVRAEAAQPRLKALPKSRRRAWMPAAAMAAVCAIALLGSGALKYLQPASGDPAAAPAAGLMAASGTPSDLAVDQTDAYAAPAEAPAVYGAQSEPTPYVYTDSVGAPAEKAAANAAPSEEVSLAVSPAANFSRSAEDGFRQALDLVVERVCGSSGYTMRTDYAEDGLSCAVTLLDGENVIDEGQITYTGLSPNEKFYCFSWTWPEQSESDAGLFRYAVPLDLSDVMWAGDSSVESFLAALEETD